jgi:cation transport ATPase
LKTGASLARTETRVIATDPAARRKFRRYWSIFSPGVVLIRRVALRLTKLDAERRARERRRPQTVSSWCRREISILNADRVRQPEVTQSRVAEVGASLARNRDSWIALLALLGIGAHLWMRYAVSYPTSWSDAPLLVVLAVGGAPLVVRLVSRAVRGEFGADHLAAVSIAASVLLGEYLAGSIVVLMLAGGDTLEHFAVAEATSVLRALANGYRRLRTAGAGTRSKTWPSARSPSATTYPSSLTKSVR